MGGCEQTDWTRLGHQMTGSHILEEKGENFSPTTYSSRQGVAGPLKRRYISIKQ